MKETENDPFTHVFALCNILRSHTRRGCLSLCPFFGKYAALLWTMQEIFSYPPKWLPARPKWENYLETFNIIPFRPILRKYCFTCGI